MGAGLEALPGPQSGASWVRSSCVLGEDHAGAVVGNELEGEARVLAGTAQAVGVHEP